MKVAIVHNWLWSMRGAERCLEVMLDIYPDADLFALFGVDYQSPRISRRILDRKPKYSWLNSIPFIERIYRHTFPLWPTATESFNLSGYDLVISSSASTVKGVIVGVDTTHLSYMYTPMRYLWDQKDLYLHKLNWFEKFFFKLFSHPVRIWDVNSTNRIDSIVAISEFVSKRIKKYYGREVNRVIYPPVDLKRLDSLKGEKIKKKNQLIMISGFQENKGAEYAVRYAMMSKKKLVLVGDGPGRKSLQAYCQGYKNIQFTGWVSEEDKIRLIQESNVVLFLGVEDFGLVPIESAYLGTPVVAYKKGGALESVEENQTGVFVNDLSVDEISERVQEAQSRKWNHDKMQKFASRFDAERFKEEFGKEIKKAMR